MYQKMKESGLTDISFDMHLTLWGQYPVLSHPESPRGPLGGVLQELTARWQANSAPTWVPSGLTVRMAVMGDLIAVTSLAYATV